MHCFNINSVIVVLMVGNVKRHIEVTLNHAGFFLDYLQHGVVTGGLAHNRTGQVTPSCVDDTSEALSHEYVYPAEAFCKSTIESDLPALIPKVGCFKKPLPFSLWTDHTSISDITPSFMPQQFEWRCTCR